MSAAIATAVKTMSEAARKAPRSRQAVLTVTQRAAERVRELMQQHPGSNALRVAVKTKGCSGNQFVLDFTKGDKGKFDEEVAAHGVKVWVDGNAVMKILNTTMDYVEDEMGQRFVFENPQVTGKCACGSSWQT